MSSFLAHAAVGVTLYLAQDQPRTPRTRWALALLLSLAMASDIDYLFYWIFAVHISPRVTHSLLFCAALVAAVWFVTAKLCTRAPRLSFELLAAAAASHLLLDYLVGVHPLPLLWPFSGPGFAAPIGVLPSAGRLSPTNFYLWRNLLIECGILLPLLGATVAICRGVSMNALLVRAAIVAPLWLGCLLWSISLTR